IVMDYLEDLAKIEPFDDTTALEGDLKKLNKKIHQTIKRVTRDIEGRFHFNTAISAVMELVNRLYQTARPEKGDVEALSVIRKAIETVIILLFPIVPHITEELWVIIGGKEKLSDISWPSYDDDIASEEEITIVLQVNGKVRSRIEVSADESDDTIKEIARNDERIQKFIGDKAILKEIYVPKKLVNIVVK
ncbi:MAG: class I tRNA ligase family protein, partial [Deltaproteobacteria bacterium]|nr:class I tRNA ligase family protein [Deltaproteobacteria bacterium]